jgi:hypothetical protein
MLPLLLGSVSLGVTFFVSGATVFVSESALETALETAWVFQVGNLSMPNMLRLFLGVTFFVSGATVSEGTVFVSEGTFFVVEAIF